VISFQHLGLRWTSLSASTATILLCKQVKATYGRPLRIGGPDPQRCVYYSYNIFASACSLIPDPESVAGLGTQIKRRPPCPSRSLCDAKGDRDATRLSITRRAMLSADLKPYNPYYTA
jgi:hypothetical protein